MWRNWQTHQTQDLAPTAWGFDSLHPHHFTFTMREQFSGRASPCQGESREFESRFPLQINNMGAQLSWIEQRPSKACVRGSNPCALTTLYRGFAKSVRHSTLTATCVGSSPASPAKLIFDPLAQSVEHLTFNQGVPRSSRGWITNYGPLVKRSRHRPFTAVTGVRFPYGSPISRDYSSAGRAPALQAGGHRFEPCQSHHYINAAWQFSWLECQPVTLEVEGSSPFQVANLIYTMLVWLNGRAADL